jgi:hypothetical protein
MVKHCAFGTCNVDSRSHPYVPFIPFVKPWKDNPRAARWAHLCGREGFSVSQITKDTYICSRHFPAGVIINPTMNPDLEPYPAKNEERVKLLALRRIRNGNNNLRPVTMEVEDKENIPNMPNMPNMPNIPNMPNMPNMAIETARTFSKKIKIIHVAVPVPYPVDATLESSNCAINLKGKIPIILTSSSLPGPIPAPIPAATSAATTGHQNSRRHHHNLDFPADTMADTTTTATTTAATSAATMSATTGHQNSRRHYHNLDSLAANPAATTAAIPADTMANTTTTDTRPPSRPFTLAPPPPHTYQF